MASGRLKLLGVHPQVKEAAEWCLAWADYYQVPVAVISGFRSWQAQADLYRNYQRCLASGEFGRTRRCRYPANRPGDSSHNYGLSWDSTIDPRFQSWWDEVRRAVGFEVLSHDQPHAQVPNWRSHV